jgi:hypothetical protein
MSSLSSYAKSGSRVPLSLGADIEDLENWHGKPVPKDRVVELLKELQNQIQVPNKKMVVELPKEDTAVADLSPIRLPKPPAYKLGDKVPHGLPSMPGGIELGLCMAENVLLYKRVFKI